VYRDGARACLDRAVKMKARENIQSVPWGVAFVTYAI